VASRLATARAIRLATERALSEPALKQQAGGFARWAQSNDAGARAGELIERLAAG